MVYLVLAGEQANAASLAELPPSVSPAAMSAFPPAAAVDNLVSKWWSQGSIIADSYFRQDLNRILNGGLDTFALGVFTSWANEIVGAGSVTQENVIRIGGSGSSAKLTVAAGGGSSTAIRQFLRVRAGSRWDGTISLNPGAAASLKLEIYCPQTNRWLDSGGNWSAAQAYHKTQAATGGFTTIPLSFVMQTRKQCGATLVDLRLRVVADTLSSVNYVDEFRLWPEINIAVLAGHNVTPGTAVELHTSTDNFVANDVTVVAAAGGPRPLVQYIYVSTSITTRWVGVKFPGTPPEAIRATEVIFGFAEAPGESPSWGFVVSRRLRQIRSHDRSLLLGPGLEDGVSLHLEPNASQIDEVEDFIMRAIDGSICVVVPLTTRPEVFLGRIGPEWTYNAKFLSTTITDIPIEPLPLPLWTP